jgi:hypothetical protein
LTLPRVFGATVMSSPISMPPDPEEEEEEDKDER